MTAIRAAMRLPPSSIALPVLAVLGVWASLTGASGETVLSLVICAALVALVAIGAFHIVSWRGGTNHADAFVELLMRLVVGGSLLGTGGVAVLMVYSLIHPSFASASLYSLVVPSVGTVLLGAGYLSVRWRRVVLAALALVAAGYVAALVVTLAETAGCWDCQGGDFTEEGYFMLGVLFFSVSALAAYALVVTGAVIARLTGFIDP